MNVGVAPGVTIVPVRTFDCGGHSNTKHIIDGLEWIVRYRQAHGGGPAVVVASWGQWVGNIQDGSGATVTEDDLTAIDKAAGNLLSTNAMVVTSADNHNTLASNYSPNRVAGVLTVGGTTMENGQDKVWVVGSNLGSNYGSAVDIWAAADNVRVAHLSAGYRTTDVSGTSFSAPLVAGVVARWLQLYPGETSENMHSRIVDRATTELHGNTILGLRAGDSNRMLYMHKCGSRCRAVSQ